jgi:hypothetical protein
VLGPESVRSKAHVEALLRRVRELRGGRMIAFKLEFKLPRLILAGRRIRSMPVRAPGTKSTQRGGFAPRSTQPLRGLTRVIGHSAPYAPPRPTLARGSPT